MITLLSKGRESLISSLSYGILILSTFAVFTFPQYSLGKTLSASDAMPIGIEDNSSPYVKMPIAANQDTQILSSPYVMIQSTSIQASTHPAGQLNKANTPVRMWIVVTAYSSTPDQTDDTPFITANGTQVHDGIVAANFLRFGTKVRFPTLYGDKVFSVEDRMNSRYSYHLDIWMLTREDAKQFGARIVPIEISQEL